MKKSGMEQRMEMYLQNVELGTENKRLNDRIAELETALEAKHQQYVGAVIQLAEARKDAERRRLALEEVLDALGALSNPYELEGYGIPDERKAEILDAARGTR